MVTDTILIIDFGGQYCHLIGRRIREMGVYSEIVPYDISKKELMSMKENMNIKGIILSGGPLSIYSPDSPKMDKEILESGIPILGICYGHQLLADYIGGRVEKTEKQEYGNATAKIMKTGDILKGLKTNEEVWMSHGDSVTRLPESISITASSTNCKIAAYEDKKRKIFGIQWHPEVAHTKNGSKILSNFIFGICKCKKEWNAEKNVIQYINNVKKEIGSGRAIMALSGGIDSTTAATIASKAIGDRLTAVFVDTGLMREGEPEKISEMAKKLNINLISINAGEKFLAELKNVKDPERKRKIIGREFIRIFEAEAKKHKAEFLIQGTIYPDRIESGHSKNSSIIKTHHNVGGIPSDSKFKKIVEPLRDLYKDEVRRLAKKIGIPEEMVYRQPFPGPGLAVRIMGKITAEEVKILKKADAIFCSEIEKIPIKERPWQYFAVVTGTKSTGVKGDSRAYGNVIALRAVESREAMTANFSAIPYEILEKISGRITAEIPSVVRVVYDITNKPPSTIEWE
jgi:GMP synthase (glutamine-hydrolysing)